MKKRNLTFIILTISCITSNLMLASASEKFGKAIYYQNVFQENSSIPSHPLISDQPFLPQHHLGTPFPPEGYFKQYEKKKLKKDKNPQLIETPSNSPERRTEEFIPLGLPNSKKNKPPFFGEDDFFNS